MLGPMLAGVNPDNISKKRLKADMIKLLRDHMHWDETLFPRKNTAKEQLPFDAAFLSLNLHTCHIQRVIDDVEYSVKAMVFVCAVEHYPFWEHTLVEGMSDKWLSLLARFYLLRQDDKSPEL
jgi:hypothetical protein